MKKKASQESPAISPLAEKKKPVAGRAALKTREAAPVKDKFDAVWIDLRLRLCQRFKNPKVFREAYERLFLMGFKPAPAPQGKDEFDLCNVLCGPEFPSKDKPLPIQVSFEPMQNGKLNPTFTYPNKDWIDAIRKAKTLGPKKDQSKLWVKSVVEKEPSDGFRLAMWAKEYGEAPACLDNDVYCYDSFNEILNKEKPVPKPQKSELSDRVCRKLGLLCIDALHNSDPAAFNKFEQFLQAVSIIRGKSTKEQAERVSRARRFIECFERLCIKRGVPPTKQELRKACNFKVPDPNPTKRREMDEKQFTREFLNTYGLYWLPVRHPWGDPRKP
jgi:hypothetical protein